MDDLKTKSFWERKEGFTGMMVLAACGVGLIFALPFISAVLGMLITILGQTIAVAALSAVVFGIGFLVLDPTVRNLVSYAFKLVMRKLTGAFVQIDPIGIMRIYIKKLEGWRDEIFRSKGKVQGQIVALTDLIKKNKGIYEESMKKAKYARDNNLEFAVNTNTRQAGRMEKLTNEQYAPMLLQLQGHLRMLNKFYDLSGNVIEDITNEVDAEEQKRKTMKAVYSAMSASKKILNMMKGGSDKDLYNAAMEYTLEDYNTKMGEIGSFLDSSKSFIDNMDMENGIYKQEGLDKLKEWEAKDTGVLLPSAEKAQLLEYTTTSNGDYYTAPLPATADYSSMLVRKK